MLANLFCETRDMSFHFQKGRQNGCRLSRRDLTSSRLLSRPEPFLPAWVTLLNTPLQKQDAANETRIELIPQLIRPDLEDALFRKVVLRF